MITRDAVAQMLNDGVTNYSVIGRRLGVSRQRVQFLAKKMQHMRPDRVEGGALLNALASARSPHHALDMLGLGDSDSPMAVLIDMALRLDLQDALREAVKRWA